MITVIYLSRSILCHGTPQCVKYIEAILGSFKGSQRSEAIKRFNRLVLQRANANDTTRLNYLRWVSQLFLLAGKKGVAVSDIDSEVCYELMGRYRNPSSRRSCAISVRLYLRLMGKEDEAAKIKLPKRNTNNLPDCLTQDEVLRVIRKCEKPRDRALLWFSYETGARSHEVRGVRIEDLTFDNYGARVLIHSNKSQSRSIRLIHSVPALQEWLNHHKDRDNPKAFLFYGRKHQLTTSGLLQIVQARARDAEVKKHVTHHIFGRHSCFAKLKKQRKLSDSILLMRAGVKTRDWLDRYGRLHPHEADRAYLEAYGDFQGDVEPEPEVLKPKPCVRCATLNSALNKFCSKCGLCLDESEAMRLSEEDRVWMKFSGLLRETLKSSPETMEKFLKLLKKL